MKKIRENLMKKEEGFTLIELIIVMAILAIIAAVAIPNIVNAVDNSRRTTDVTNARMIAESVAIVRAKYEKFAAKTYASGSELVINKTNVKAPAAGVAPTSFEQALAIELSDNVPLPQFKSTGTDAAGASAFQLELGGSGTIKITVNTTAKPEVYPNADSGVYAPK